MRSRRADQSAALRPRARRGRACALFALACGIAVAWGDPQADFDAANRLYEQRNYAEAAAAYQAILEDGRVSAALHFNLGNALFKQDRRGRAIVHYLRALALDPRDRDARQSLAHAREAVSGVKQDRSAGSSWRWVHALSSDQWTLIGAAGFWALALALAAGQLSPPWRPRLRPVSAAAAAVCATGVGLATFTAASHSLAGKAVIVAPQAIVRFGPLQESQTAFQLPDGAEIAILDEKDDWLRVRTAAGQSGWVIADRALRLDAKESLSLPKTDKEARNAP